MHHMVEAHCLPIGGVSPVEAKYICKMPDQQGELLTLRMRVDRGGGSRQEGAPWLSKL